MRTIACLAILLSGGLAPSAFASVLTSSPGDRTLESVNIADSAQANVAGRSYALKLLGAGYRYKKVAFVHAKVYVGEFFADAPEKIKKTAEQAPDSLGQEKVVAVRMTFLRDVDAEKVRNGFKEALEDNQVNLSEPAVAAFLEAVHAGGEAKDGKALIVLGERLGEGKEAVTYETSAGKVITVQGGSGFVRSIFSMWLGKTNDSGVQHLQNGIFGLAD